MKGKLNSFLTMEEKLNSFLQWKENWTVFFNERKTEQFSPMKVKLNSFFFVPKILIQFFFFSTVTSERLTPLSIMSAPLNSSVQYLFIYIYLYYCDIRGASGGLYSLSIWNQTEFKFGSKSDGKLLALGTILFHWIWKETSNTFIQYI